jgi:hypothetical protein
VARYARDDGSILALVAVGKKLVEDLAAQEVETPGKPWFVGCRMAGRTSGSTATTVAVDPIVLIHSEVKSSLRALVLDLMRQRSWVAMLVGRSRKEMEQPCVDALCSRRLPTLAALCAVGPHFSGSRKHGQLSSAGGRGWRLCGRGWTLCGRGWMLCGRGWRLCVLGINDLKEGVNAGRAALTHVARQ